MAVSLDEFFDMAKLGGQIQACHDIFDILGEKDADPAKITIALSEYQDDVVKKFKKAQLRFKMNGSMVAVDEESVDSLR